MKKCESCRAVENFREFSDVSQEDCESAPQLVMDDGLVYSEIY